MSAYLQQAEFSNYNVPAGVSQEDIFEASSYIDSYLRRPEGMVWLPDFAGMPAYMANLSPTITLTLTAPLAAGSNVLAQVTPPIATPDLIGEVFIIDRATVPPSAGPNVCEACVVGAWPQINPAAAQPSGSILLANVQKPHAAGALLEAGLTIVESRPLLKQRSTTRIARTHPVLLVSGVGRYGYGRKSDIVAGTYNEINLLATLSTFGGPPQWNPFDVRQCALDFSNGELWIPASILLAYFTDVRVRYLAGFAANAVPDPIKRACARIVTNKNVLPAEIWGGAVRRVARGSSSIDRLTRTTPGRGAGAGETILDQNSMALLDPYKIRSLY